MGRGALRVRVTPPAAAETAPVTQQHREPLCERHSVARSSLGATPPAVKPKVRCIMSRLATLSHDLVTKLHGASAVMQRRACIAACELVIDDALLQHPLVSKLFRQLRAGHVFSPQEQKDIDEFVAQSDENYFSLREAAETGEVATGDYLRAFAKARALSALSFAGSNKPDAASESIYEAAAAIGDDKTELFLRIEAALR